MKYITGRDSQIRYWCTCRDGLACLDGRCAGHFGGQGKQSNDLITLFDIVINNFFLVTTDGIFLTGMVNVL